MYASVSKFALKVNIYYTYIDAWKFNFLYMEIFTTKKPIQRNTWTWAKFIASHNIAIISTMSLLFRIYAIAYTGWSTFLSCIDCTLPAWTVVPWAWLYRVLRCNHIKIISSLSWISYTKSASLGVARRWFAKIFVIDDICRCLLYVSVHCIIDGSDTDGCTRRVTRGANKYMPTNEMGICDAI